MMVKRKNRKKNKLKVFFCLLFFIFLAVYGGVKGGEYLARKLTKPIEGSGSLLDEMAGEEKKETDLILSQDEMVSLTALTTEFLAAEHSKKSDYLASMVDGDYYSALLKRLKSLSQGQAVAKNIDYKVVEKDFVKVEVEFVKNNKNYSEIITLSKINNIWKVTGVDTE